MSNHSINISTLWDDLTVSIWFLPLVMSVAGILLAITTLQLDAHIESLPWTWARGVTIDAAGVRQVVSVTSGAMITITGVVFSISIVSLTLASNQFGPKILRNYLRDTGNKFVLGLFVATFLYGLLILASVDTQGTGFIPIWSMMVSLLLTMLAVGGLIYYIHNISTAIQADHIIALMGEELDHSIDHLMQPLDEDAEISNRIDQQELEVQKQALKAQAIRAPKNGYIQTIDYGELAAVAEEYGGLIEIDQRAGHFVIRGCILKHCYTPRQVDDMDQRIVDQIVFGRQRTPIQDIEFTLTQLVQIALRALSPSSNDSLTAVTCIDWLSAALGRMAQCAFPACQLRDETGVLRVVLKGFSFEGAVNAVFDPLRQCSRHNEIASIRLLEALEQLIEVTDQSNYRGSLFNQAQLIYHAAMASIPAEADRDSIAQRFSMCQQAFDKRQA